LLEFRNKVFLLYLIPVLTATLTEWRRLQKTH
jgi:hypothetical protein